MTEAAIESIETDHFRIPLPTVFSDATHGEISHFELVTARIRDAEGAEGLGYTYTVGAGGGAVRSLIADDLVPLLVGEVAGRIERLWERMWWGVHFVGRGGPAAFAIAALDTALWDLKAKRAATPLWRFLGGHDARVPAYAGGIDLHFPTDRLLDQARKNLADGFEAIKMKLGRDSLAEDIARVAAMRDLLGPDRTLMVDANMGWDVECAVRAARALQAHDVYWLEEPTIPDDVEGHVRIMQAGGLPVATGENFHTLYEFERMIAAGGVAFPEPDLATCGGITVWLKVAHLAEARNLPVTSHGVHDLHVHLLAAVPNSSYLEIHGFALDRFIETPLAITEGHATAPDRPGHGVVFDWDKLASHRV